MHSHPAVLKQVAFLGCKLDDKDDMSAPLLGQAGDDGDWSSSDDYTTDEERPDAQQGVPAKPVTPAAVEADAESPEEAQQRKQQKLMAFLTQAAEIRQRMRERREGCEQAEASEPPSGSTFSPPSRVCSMGRVDEQDGDRPTSATSTSTDTPEGRLGRPGAASTATSASSSYEQGSAGEAATADAEATRASAEDAQSSAERPTRGPGLPRGDQIEEHLEKLRRMKETLANIESAAACGEDAKISAYLAACQKFSDDDYEGAISDFDEVLHLNDRGAPKVEGLDDAEVYSLRGQAKAKLGDLVGAIDDLTDAVRNNNRCASAWFRRASLRSDSGDHRGAEDDFTKVLRLEPKNTEALCCRGTTRFVLGDLEGCIEDSTEALRVDEDCANAHGLRGVVRIRVGDDEGGLEDCERALELDESLEWVRATYNEACARTRVAQVSPAEIQAGDSDVARRAFAEFDAAQVRQGLPADLASSASPCRTWGNALFREGKLREAVAAYGEAHRAGEPGSMLALSNKAICHLKLGDYDDAVEAADTCLKERDVPHKVFFTKFKALAARGDWADAFETMRTMRSRPGVPKEILEAADKEEREKRMEYEVLKAAGEAGLEDAPETNAED